MPDPPVRRERTHWRDLALNDRHRLWGFNCPAIDIDWMIEYDNGQPAGLVEYSRDIGLKKPWQPGYDPQTNGSRQSINAFITFSTMAGLPAFGAIYTSNFSGWTITPLNRHARKWLASTTKMTEFEWVSLLYRLRGRTVPIEVYRLLKGA